MNSADILDNKLDFTEKTNGDGAGIKNLAASLLNYWYLVLISISICLLVTFVFIKSQPPQFIISSKIIVDDDKNSAARTLTSGMNSDFSSLFDIKSNAYNEVKVLESRSLLRSVIENMGLNYHLFKRHYLGIEELFGDAPVEFSPVNNRPLRKTAAYKITVESNNRFKVTNIKTAAGTSAVFDKPLQLDNLDGVITRTGAISPGQTFRLTANSLKEEEHELSSKFFAALDDKQSTVINLQLTYSDPDKGEKILETLMRLYLQNNRANKIRIADSTMKFIDNRLLIVGAELNKVEKNLQEYKVNNKISDMGAQSKMLVETAGDYEKKLNDNDVQLAIAADLYKYVKDGSGKRVVPSSLITHDMSFGSAINEYNNMLLRREELQLNLNDASAPIKNLDQQISVARQALQTSLENYLNSLRVSGAALKKQNAAVENTITSAPAKQRIYLDFTRQQSLKQDLYLFLLQKREETAISQTVTLSNCRILDNAESDEKPFSPKKSLLYMIGLFVGITLPAAGIGIRNLFRNKISTKTDISNNTDIPVLGEISKNTTRNTLLAEADSRSIIAEEIRAVRTNLKYVTSNNRSNVILFTSSMSGEGKSFLSLNIGNSIALAGKKVLLMELDLRRPKLTKYSGGAAKPGFTDYVTAGDTVCIKKFITLSDINENLFFISSGHIPPNPAELLTGSKLDLLFAELRKSFDYILIDSPPVGQVSDALIIEEYADITCYVVRQNYTYKSQLGIVNDLKKNGKVKQLYLLINDIEIKNNSITGYGYGYGYGGYNLDDGNKKNKLVALINKLKIGTTT